LADFTPVDVELLQTFFSLLAFIALIGGIVLIGARLLASRVPAARQLVLAVQPFTLWAAFAVAATSMAGSLYFSEVENYVPCRYCWFQRIAMFPLVIVLLVAAIRKDRAVKWTAGPIAGIGALLSGYHVLLERGVFDEGSACSATGVPCAVPWFETFGFVTLAVMAFCGFIAIIALVTSDLPTPDPEES
jgi:disulfide bond formation protein DsbB